MQSSCECTWNLNGVSVRLLSLLLLSLFALSAGAADWTWNGAVNSNWGHKPNWTTSSLAAVPQTGDTVILAAGTAKPSNQNIPNLSIFKIVIPLNIQVGTVVGGQPITLAGGVEFQNAAHDFAFSTPFILSAQQRWTIAAGRTLSLSGALTANLDDLEITGNVTTSNKLITNVNSVAGLVAGMPIEGSRIADTWIESINGSTLTLTRNGELPGVDALFHVTQCWIVDGSGVLDISAADGVNFNAPILATAGTVRFGLSTQLKGGALIASSATLELKQSSGTVALTKTIVSLGALSGNSIATDAPALLVHSGDTLVLPAAPGVALSGQGGGTQNAFRMSGTGSVTFIQADDVPSFAIASLRLESGTSTVDALAQQPTSTFTNENGVLQFNGNATLNVNANTNVATTALNGSVAPLLPSATFTSRYGPRQISALSGTARLNIGSGALVQNNVNPLDENVLVGSGATLIVAGADDTSIFRLGRKNSDGATSGTLNTGRFDLRGGQFYVHEVPGVAPYSVFPSQPGFTLALNGGVFNGNRCEDHLGDLSINDTPVAMPRIDNFAVSGSGAIRWGAGVLEKINVVDDPQGHNSSERQHALTFGRSGGSVQVAAGARLRISAGRVVANAFNPFADTALADRYVAIENNATLELSGADKTIGTLSGTNPAAAVQLFSLINTIYSAVDSSYAGGFQGSGSLMKSGSGALRLTGDQTAYLGQVSIAGGTLIADNALSSTGSQAVAVNAAGTLAGAGKVIGAVNLNGTLKPGSVPFSAGDNTLETGALTVNVGSALRFPLTATPATSSVVLVAGNLTLNGSAVYIANAGGVTTGDYPLLMYTGTFAGDFTQMTLTEMPPGFSGKLVHDTANKTILLRIFVPPVSAIAQPVQSLYRATTWPGSISGTVADSNGVGISTVEVSLRSASGEYFNGVAFASVNEVWIPSTVNGLSWSLAFPVSNFTSDGGYTLRVRATDNGANVENPPAQRSVTIDRTAPVVTVNALSTASASPALSGTVNDPNASVLVSINGSSVAAQNNAGVWTVAAGALPGRPAGAYDVVVHATDAAGNVGVDTTTNELTITLPNISIAQVTPLLGSAAGGTLVTVTGTNLELVTAIKFGADAGAVQSKSPSSVTVLSPEHDAGAIAITVESLSNTVVLSNAFSYFNPPPSITLVTPSRVSTNGGTLITINGAGFLSGAVVQVDGKPATAVVRVSAKILTARVPSRAPGAAAVTIVNPDSNAVSLPNAVVYDQPPQLNSAPQLSSGQVQAGSPVQVLFGLFDPEGGAVTYSVDWGDGSAAGLNTIHTYVNAGVYTLTLTASDGIGISVHTISVTVAGAPGGGGSPTPIPSANSLQIDALSGAVRFDVTGKDSFKLSGVFPAFAMGSSFANVESTIDVGGATERFVLSAKGKGKNAAGALTLRLKFLKNKTTRALEYNGAPIPFSVSAKGTFASMWTDENLRENGGTAGVSEPFAVRMTIGAAQADGTAVANTAVRAGKSGKFSFKKSK